MAEPAATPMADVTTNANAAPAKTVSLLASLSDANSIVASCVLSPSSAIKTDVKTVDNIFQSMKNLLGMYFTKNFLCSFVALGLLVPTEKWYGRKSGVQALRVRG